LQKRGVGQTGILVSTIGLGTVKFGRNQQVKYPSPFELPSDKEIISLLETAKELGINLLDTAPAYGTSEERLGQLLTHRHDWVISTKVGETFINGESHFDFSSEAIRASIERSLKNLNTDYLDIVLVHSDGNDLHLINELDVFSALQQLKDKGLIRAYGISTKTIEGGLKTLELADLAMVTYNPNYTDEKPVLDFAAKHNKGIFIKKAFGSGHLNPADCLPFILAHAGVSSVILGTISPHHLIENSQLINKL
jgi:aryl-alcohol dehydrogenase-like predicted oxidoreductase